MHLCGRRLTRSGRRSRASDALGGGGDRLGQLEAAAHVMCWCGRQRARAGEAASTEAYGAASNEALLEATRLVASRREHGGGGEGSAAGSRCHSFRRAWPGRQLRLGPAFRKGQLLMGGQPLAGCPGSNDSNMTPQTRLQS
eukprot:355027-Chlamydomonas_euryale.AAC.2